MTASDDEYDTQAGGPIELTEQDCAAIDAISAGTLREILPFNVPHVDIEVATDPTRQVPVLNRSMKPVSPMKRYRRNGRLSVSDLVSPAWCEVQFEYGLLQHRSRKLVHRPETFVSREGKQIHVKKKQAQKNDVVLQQGTAVHTALEREIHPTKVEVATVTMEEHWGLRLFNMISDLQTLVLIGKCREFRVMGFIHNHFVTGIIDEITRTPILDDRPILLTHKRTREASAPSTPSKPKPKRYKSGTEPVSPEKQLKIDSFFPVTPGKSTGSLVRTALITEHTPAAEYSSAQVSHMLTSPPYHRSHILRIVDSKTRLSPSLPLDSDTLSSRLQLMTYKRLLDALLTPEPPFEFSKLWKHMGLNPERPFSNAFMEKVQLLGPAEEYEAKCLKDMEKYWWTIVWKLGITAGEAEQSAESGAPVDAELKLIYRLRGAGSRQKGKRRSKSPSSESSKSSEQDIQGSSSRKKGKRKAKSPSAPPVSKSQESSSDQENSEKAIQESLRNAAELGQGGGELRNSAPLQKTLPPATSGSKEFDALEAQIGEETLDAGLQYAIQESLKTSNGQVRQQGAHDEADSGVCDKHILLDKVPVDNAPVTLPILPGDVIGQKTFKHDDLMLDAHITSILAWWHGKREPRGVEVEESRRCHTCEYMQGCEWREKKAFEAQGKGVML